VYGSVEIVPSPDGHVDTAAELLAERHALHRAAEPLLPAEADFRAQVESEWTAEGASGVISEHGYVFGRPDSHGWFTVGIGGHPVVGDAEHARDLYASAAGPWREAGHSKHMVFLSAYDTDVVDAWFRLSFGASAVPAMRETAPEEPYDGVSIRPGTPDDDAIDLAQASTEPEARGSGVGRALTAHVVRWSTKTAILR
jgi:GNAT superfamily N-acetyltransferase